MAHRKAKQEAFELFKKGFFPQDTAACLNINVRTCQRWFKEYIQTENVATSEHQKSSDAACLALVEEKLNLPNFKNDDGKEKVQRIGENWVQSAEVLANEHFCSHRQVRLKVEKILEQKLAEDELNLRAIQTLSLALTRHVEGERIAFSLDYLDLNRGAKALEARGYTISEQIADLVESDD